MPPSTRTSKTAGETADEAAGTTGAETSPSTDTDNAEDLKVPPKGPRIVFAGPSTTIRRLTTVDFTKHDVDAPASKVEWSQFPGGNNHEVDVSDWSEDQIRIALAADDRFSHKTD